MDCICSVHFDDQSNDERLTTHDSGCIGVWACVCGSSAPNGTCVSVGQCRRLCVCLRVVCHDTMSAASEMPCRRALIVLRVQKMPSLPRCFVCIIYRPLQFTPVQILHARPAIRLLESTFSPYFFRPTSDDKSSLQRRTKSSLFRCGNHIFRPRLMCICPDGKPRHTAFAYFRCTPDAVVCLVSSFA